VRDEAVEVIEQEGFKAKIYQDEDPMSPKEWDQLGTLVTWHRRCCFDVDGQKEFGSSNDFKERAEAEGWLYLLVGMIDHSGISLYVGGGSHWSDSAGWDSGTVGVIYTTPEKIRENFLIAKDAEIPAETMAQAENVLRSEVETWDQYVTGDVYGIVVEGSDGEVLESVWGFYGHDDVKEEAMGMLKGVIEHEKQERKKIERMMAL